MKTILLHAAWLENWHGEVVWQILQWSSQACTGNPGSPSPTPHSYLLLRGLTPNQTTMVSSTTIPLGRTWKWTLHLPVHCFSCSASKFTVSKNDVWLELLHCDITGHTTCHSLGEAWGASTVLKGGWLAEWKGLKGTNQECCLIISETPIIG